MAGTVQRTNPALWNTVKSEITRASKGGEANQWSARKAQLAVAEYKKRGGGYKTAKAADNHLVQWTNEAWGTQSGQPSRETHERYLPEDARRELTDTEYRRTTAKKHSDTERGKQVSQQPKDIARKVARTRKPRHDSET